MKSATRQKHLPLNQYVPLSRPVGEEDYLLGDLLCTARTDEPEAAVLNRRLSDYLDRFGETELSELENEVIRRRLEGKSLPADGRRAEVPAEVRGQRAAACEA